MWLLGLLRRLLHGLHARLPAKHPQAVGLLHLSHVSALASRATADNSDPDTQTTASPPAHQAAGAPTWQGGGWRCGGGALCPRAARRGPSRCCSRARICPPCPGGLSGLAGDSGRAGRAFYVAVDLVQRVHRRLLVAASQVPRVPRRAPTAPGDVHPLARAHRATGERRATRRRREMASGASSAGPHGRRPVGLLRRDGDLVSGELAPEK